MDEQTVPKGKVKRTCEVCGVVFEKYHSQVMLGQGRFCNAVCRSRKPQKPREKREPRPSKPDLPQSAHVIYHRLCLGEGRLDVLESEGWTPSEWQANKHPGQVLRLAPYWPFDEFVADYRRLGFDGLRKARGINNVTAKKWLLYLGEPIRKHGQVIPRETTPRETLTTRPPMMTCVDALVALRGYPRISNTVRGSSLAAIVRRWRACDWFRLYADGLTFQEIAERADVGFKTVHDALSKLPSRIRGPGRNWEMYHRSRSERLAYIRGHALYKQWRDAVLIANPRCVWCDSSRALQVDHITPFIQLVDSYGLHGCTAKALDGKLKRARKLWDVRNGRTLCATCHRQTQSYGGAAVNWTTNQGCLI